MTEINQDNSVSAVLIYCKRSVLSPYFRLISFLGWRPLLSHRSPTASPLTTTQSNQCFNTLISVLINFIYTLLILILIFSAYFLSYCTCYRGDGLPHFLPLIVLNNLTISTNNYLQDNNIQSNNLNTTTLDGNFIVNSTFNNTDNSDYNESIITNQSSSNTLNLVTQQIIPTITATINNQPADYDNLIELTHNSSTCNNKLISHFIIPDVLHFASYLFLLYLLRSPECERLENLMERAFLQLSQTANWFLESRHLISTLRSFLLLSVLWIICSMILHIFHFNITLVNFNCLPDSLGVNLLLHQSSSSPIDVNESNSIISDYLSTHYFINVNHVHTIIIYITVTCLTVFDIICSAVVTSYAVHCQLNISFINSLCQGVREKRISFQEFYQRAEESRKFVSYLNNNQAICVSLIAIVFICKICLYSFQLISKYNNATNYSLLILSAILWIIILLIPMIQAVRLTDSCYGLRNLGHELKARPFGYQHTDEFELNSLLVYTSSLDMTAKLFNLSIRSSSIVLIFTIILIGVPLLGQIGVISL